MQIAILLTTFLRDELLDGAINSIKQNWQPGYTLLIADQNPSEAKLAKYSGDNTFYYGVPYDCGLSASRNFLVDKAVEMNIEYCLLIADSIFFISKYDFTPYIDILKADKELGLIGFDLKDRQPWEKFLTLKPDGFHVKDSKEKKIINGMEFTVCDAVRNFFLAKTQILHNVKWDNELRLAEHEDFMHRLKLSGVKVLYNSGIVAQYVLSRPEAYAPMRGRLYNVFARKLREKYNIKRWIVCDP